MEIFKPTDPAINLGSPEEKEPSQVSATDHKDLFIPEHEGRSPETPVMLKPPEDELRKKSLETKSATTIQALVRGHQTRKKTVFPSEIKGFLDSNLTALKTTSKQAVNTDTLSKSIAREILELSNSGALRRHGIKLQAGKKYAFQGGSITLPVDMWVRKTETGVELEMIGQRLGSGTYKTVHLSRTFTVDLMKESHEKQLENTVVVRPSQQDTEKNIQAGMIFIQKNFSKELLAGTIHLAGVLSHRARQTGGTMEARDVQYDGEFGAIPLTQSQSLQVLADTAKTLQQFHAKGLVHRDVKPPNILVKNGRGYAADFDLSGKQGLSKTKSNYLYWDPLSQKGVVTPLSDAHGLARTACQTLFGTSWYTSEDDIRSLPQFQKPTPELEPIRDAISAVFEANKQTLEYLGQNRELIKQLRSSDPELIASTVQQLQEKFPAYSGFLKLMASYDKTPATASSVS